jgi:hypothetical protein
MGLTINSQKTDAEWSTGVAVLSVLEGSDQDLLGHTFEQIPASTNDLSIG